MKYMFTVLTVALSFLGPSSTLRAQCTSFPVVDLGTDTTFCGTSFVMNAGNPGLNFLWSTNDTLQSLSVASSGLYFVTVTDSLGCSTTDSIQVTLNDPAVAGIISISGGDTMLCGEEYAWFYSTGHSGSVIWWVMDTLNWVWMPFGTGDTIDFGNVPNGINGFYQFLITTVNGNCPPDTADIFTVEMHSSPVVALPNDGLVCSSGFSIDAGYSGLQHLWNNGSTSQFQQIDSSGTYYVTVSDTNGCFGSDTVHFTIPPQIVVVLNALSDTVCLIDAPLVLSGTPQGGTFSGMGVSGNIFDPSQAGPGAWNVYYLVTDSLGCTFGDDQVVSVENCVGLQETNTPFIHVYPNPSNDFIAIEGMVEGSKIEIIDLQGKASFVESVTSPQGKNRIDVNFLADGLYFIRITDHDNSTVLCFSKVSTVE